MVEEKRGSLRYFSLPPFSFPQSHLIASSHCISLLRNVCMNEGSSNPFNFSCTIASLIDEVTFRYEREIGLFACMQPLFSLSVTVGESKTLKYPTDYPSFINHIGTTDHVSGVRVDDTNNFILAFKLILHYSSNL